MAEVKLISLKKTFGNITAVNEINLDIKDKEFFVLLGPTGAGKTTTLRLVAGLEKPDKGEIYLEKGDKELARREFELALKYNKNFESAQKSLKDL